MVNNQFRSGIYLQATNFLEQFKSKKNLLVNLFGIDGMGKTSFIIKIMPEMLSKSNVKHKILSISRQNNVSELAIELLEWGYSNLLKSNQKINFTVLRNDLEKIESAFVKLASEIRNQKHWIPFAVLIDGLDNLSVDDLDWFQGAGIESFNSIPNSMIIITSHNELRWHSWELRNLCKRIPLSGFSYDEVRNACSSLILAKRISQLSGGHPATVEALLRIAKQENHNFAMIGAPELNNLNKLLLKELRTQLDKTLSARTKLKWLREVFWIAAAADKFDADLLSDITKEGGIKIPDDISDIAWEMAYTGLVTWDSESQTYKMIPEIRDRINQYNLNAERTKYIQMLKAIAKYYQTLTKDSPNTAKTRSVVANDYLARAKKIQSSTLENKIDGGLRKIAKLKRAGGKKMLTTSRAGTEKIYVSRKSAEEIFRKLIRGQMNNKWMLGIQGEAGIGKSYLLKRYQEIAEGEGYSVVVLDLNFAKNRQRELFLNEIVNQTNLKSAQVRRAMEPLLESKRSSKVVYMGIESTETFDYYTTNAATVIALELKNLVKQKKRPVVIVDTFDDSPGISQLAVWLFGEVLHEFRDSIYLVVAGRKSLLEVIKGDLVNEVKLLELGGLAKKDIHEIAKRWKKMWGGQFNEDLVSSVERISAGNPLIASWVLFYITEFASLEDLQWLVSVSDKSRALKRIADFILGEKRSTRSDVSTFKGLQAAIHFGSYFNLDLFKAAVPIRSLKGKLHKEVFNHIAGYFFVRGAVDNWTLHDQIRDWMRTASKNDKNVPEFINLSQNAIKNYYEPRIEKLGNKRNKSIEDQANLDSLQAQRFSNLLYVQSEPNAHVADYHLELWDHLDSLWHRYRLEQMAQVIQYGRDVQAWKPSAQSDSLLTNILDAAQAWAYFSQANYEQAQETAQKIINSNVAPRRLYATAQVILGLLPTQNPEKAITSYLVPAKTTFLQILKELQENRFPENEFTDGIQDVYPEIHQVLMGIGRMHLLHLYDLEKGEIALKDAYEISRVGQWNNPLYQATALNEWARTQRFEGNFSDALTKIMMAIAIYKKERKNPETDVNFGYFYETLGMIQKELGQFAASRKSFEKSLQIYNNIQGPMELRKATVLLETGHVYLLEDHLEEARKFLIDAYHIFKPIAQKHPWYYLNSVNKMGEYYTRINDKKQARKYFLEQRTLAKKFGHDLWEYWALQHLAELDYEKNKKVDKKSLEKLLIEYDKKRGRKLGPAFWRTKYLLFQIAKDEGENSLALKHLTEGLAYLAGNWKAMFWQNLGILRAELLDLDSNLLVQEADHIRKIWKDKFPNQDPVPAFVDMLNNLTAL